MCCRRGKWRGRRACNRTYVELKYEKRRAVRVAALDYNRTYVELKSGLQAHQTR